MLIIGPPFGNYLNLPYTKSIIGSITVENRPGLINRVIKTLHYSEEYKGWINKIGLGIIKYIDIENYRDLPTVFGKKENFKILYENLKKINFPLDLIKKYYLYESNRWDLETYQKKVVKQSEARPFKVPADMTMMVVDPLTGEKAKFTSKNMIVESYKSKNVVNGKVLYSDNNRLDINNILEFY